MLNIESFVAGRWVAPDDSARLIEHAVDGTVFARAGKETLDAGEMLDFAISSGGPALRAMTFHDRARMLKALALHLKDHRKQLYDLSFATGATQSDHLIDVDGGIGTMLVIASKGRREMPDGHVYLDGDTETLSRNGTFKGQHICTPLQGVAVHINAFNFPVWGMLEKLAPTLLAGMPAIVKPATSSCYVTERAVRIMLDSGILPDGAVQLVTGGLGDLLHHLGPQDAVSFTGSADTAKVLRATPALQDNAVRFTAEQDSLNATILAPDAQPGSPEFDLSVTEIHREMTTKTGQKCTAIRRVLAPENALEALAEALVQKLGNTVIGDPRDAATGMGALISQLQKADVLQKADLLASEATNLFGNPNDFTVQGADGTKGAFLPPMLFCCDHPDIATHVHQTEAFGPVATLMPYRDLDHAIALANKGQGSLVASVMTQDSEVARRIVLGSASYHGRLYFNNRSSMAEATGHGAPLPHMVHGGPGRAGGGEELGGIRGVMHYMQRTAVQASPDLLTGITGQWIPGAATVTHQKHPFRRSFGDLAIGETFNSDTRKVTTADIEHFAAFTGDTFYAHMDDAAAQRNPFFPGRVAHGYLLLSFAAGLFVDPDEGPVLANTGLDGLRFLKPVSPDDAIQVQLTVRRKTPRNDDYGEVQWFVQITNETDEPVAEYTLLTMNRF